jgi:thiol-disulfide isomerase/thioredoxin
LLNFWFPECGPCHGEFTSLQKMLDKYKDQGFMILAVNVQPAQDDLVLPLLKGFKLGFFPLKTDNKIEVAFGVHGEPTSFLIGPDGRIWFRLGPVFDAAKQRTLELQIEALLHLKNRTGSSQVSGGWVDVAEHFQKRCGD